MDFLRSLNNLEKCRVCLQEKHGSTYLGNIDAFESESEGHTIRHKLSKCLPELELSVTPSAAICINCLTTVNSIFELKKVCLQTEEEVQSSIQEIGSSHINLADSIQEEVSVKQDPDEIDIKDEPLHEPIYNYTSNLIENELKEEDFEVAQSENEKKVCEVESVSKTESLLLHTDNTVDYSEQKPYNKSKLCNKLAVSSHRADSLVQQVETCTRKYECNLCDYKASQKLHLVLHMRTHTGERPYECNLCDYKATQKSTIDAHMRTHTGEKPFECSECSRKFSRKSTLIKHVRIHTGERPYKCNSCDYKAALKSSLIKHMRTHTREKPFECSECPQKFARRNTLIKHVRTHTGERPYECKLCDYRAARKSTLDVHMRTHTVEKPFACSQCSKKFANKQNLAQHVRIHTGEQPYKCNSCDYKAAQRSNLVQHMRTHTGEKPYKCSECSRKFATSSPMRRHMKIHRKP